jgi:SAM-dependent methyltransferase
VLHRQVFVAPEQLQRESVVEVVCCVRCGVGFSDIPTAQDALDDIYRDHSKYADTTLYSDDVPDRPPTDAPWDLQRLAATASWLAEQTSLDARVLDAGCATGALLGFLKREGFTNIVGLDPSPSATATAARTYGVPTVTGSFFDPPDDLGSFDLVVLSHVLEHLTDVSGAIAGMWQLTRPGGCVYIEVPDACRYVHHLVAPFHDFNTEHINHFSPQTLQLAMELGGFTTEHLATKDVMCSPVDTYPAVYGVFRRDPITRQALDVVYDDGLPQALERYVEQSQELLERITAHIRAELGDRRVAVWGAGQLSMKLLAELDDREVVALVDTSESKWGMRYGDLIVVGPQEIADGTEPILITSIHHETSIVNSIRAALPEREYIRLRP